MSTATPFNKFDEVDTTTLKQRRTVLNNQNHYFLHRADDARRSATTADTTAQANDWNIKANHYLERAQQVREQTKEVEREVVKRQLRAERLPTPNDASFSNLQSLDEAASLFRELNAQCDNLLEATRENVVASRYHEGVAVEKRAAAANLRRQAEALEAEASQAVNTFQNLDKQVEFIHRQVAHRLAMMDALRRRMEQIETE